MQLFRQSKHCMCHKQFGFSHCLKRRTLPLTALILIAFTPHLALASDVCGIGQKADTLMAATAPETTTAPETETSPVPEPYDPAKEPVRLVYGPPEYFRGETATPAYEPESEIPEDVYGPPEYFEGAGASEESR